MLTGNGTILEQKLFVTYCQTDIMRERMTWQHQIQMNIVQSNTTVRAKYTARESDVSEP